MHRFVPIFSALVALAMVLPLMPALAQSGGTPRLVFQTTIPGTRQIKFPDVVAGRDQVFVSANVNRADAFVWQKQDRATSFPAPTRLGDAPGQADFSTTSVAMGPDGATHYIWINQENRTIYYRRKPLNGDWGPQRVVYAGGSNAFPVNAVIEVSSDNFAYVAWREPDRPAVVVRSNNDGQTWSPRVSVGTRAAFNSPALAAGPNGTMAVAVTIGESNRLTIQGGFWDGSSFSLARISPLTGDFADPTLTYDPDGKLYVAYRSVASDGSTSGIWVATFSEGNTWVLGRIVGEAETFGTANIYSDNVGNLHLQWNAVVDLGQRVYYTVRPKGSSTFTAPISAPNDAGVIFNSRLSANVSDAAYAHVVGEMFGGGDSVLRYLLFAAESGANVGAAPKIRDDAQFARRDTTVAVSFLNIRGQPTQIRWRWNAAPTDAENDSNGWQTFTNPTDIALPDRLFTAPCVPVRLFTQVREADGDTGLVESDDIILDAGVQAALLASNPHSARKASTFTPAGGTLDTVTPADVGTGGASDGHPGYTREPIYYLEVRGINDCSGVKDVAAGRTTTSIARAIPLQQETFANVLGYPGPMTPGENALLIRVSDNAGNVADYPQTLFYDPTKPELVESAQDSLQVSTSPNATIMASLRFSNVRVTDNAYPSPGFWGVWIANSRQPVDNPATDSGLVWIPVRAPGDSADFTLNNWSLASGLRADQVTPGAYYVYVRFLDGAGNPTDGYLAATVNLTSITYPKVYAPAIRR